MSYFVELLIQPGLLLTVYLCQLLVLRVQGFEFPLQGLDSSFEIEVSALECLKLTSDVGELFFQENNSLMRLYLA